LHCQKGPLQNGPATKWAMLKWATTKQATPKRHASLSECVSVVKLYFSFEKSHKQNKQQMLYTFTALFFTSNFKKDDNYLSAPEFFAPSPRLCWAGSVYLAVGDRGLIPWPSQTKDVKRVSVEIGRLVRSFCPWVRHLTKLPLPLSGLTDSTRRQLDSKTEKVPLLSPGRCTLTNK